jgi:hypothetical protein
MMEEQAASKKRPAEEEAHAPSPPPADAIAAAALWGAPVQTATAELAAQVAACNTAPVGVKPKGAPRGRYVTVDPNRPKKAKVPRGPSENNTGSSLKSGGTCTACAGSKVRCRVRRLM